MYQISGLSIGFIGISLILCLTVPVFAVYYMKRQQGATLRSFLIGMMTFIFFALIAEQALHMLVLGMFQAYMTDPKHLLVYAMYGGLAAAVFEETGRFVAMKYLMRNHLYKKEALMYGLGHGGVEAILIGGIGSFSNLATALSINSGALDASIAAHDQNIIAAVEQMVAMPSWQFLLVGVERMAAMVLHVCLSYLVYRAVKHGRVECFGAALLIHFLVDAVTVFLAAKLPVLVIEIGIILVDCVLAFFVYRMYQSEVAAEVPGITL